MALAGIKGVSQEVRLMISGIDVAVSKDKMEQIHTERVHDRINQFVTIKFSSAVLTMLFIGLSIGSILQFAISDARTAQIVFAAVGIVSLFASFIILKKSQKLSSGKEIHISSDNG